MTKHYTWNGSYGQQGSAQHSTKTNGNKGILRQYRQALREEAEDRDARSAHQSDGRRKREGLDT